ncbi:hypothetical protein [Allostreptomyces psammosilenae]|uniref:DNA-binding protein n=1 Tax=Allostreptomyces psammosilenae TaxID=1892865 RepID=A0A852ZXR0_9ACTN|nr:hypothetical protein [Allostreptomyces psammosilenae]NYI03421.1 hypothetical protein [Allostreptomyces psammosilenae]
MEERDAMRVVQGMNVSDVLALPVVIDLETGNRALGLGRSTGYDLARRGLYPCKVLRIGRTYRVVTADLCRVAGRSREGEEGSRAGRRDGERR